MLDSGNSSRRSRRRRFERQQSRSQPQQPAQPATHTGNLYSMSRPMSRMDDNRALANGTSSAVRRTRSGRPESPNNRFDLRNLLGNDKGSSHNRRDAIARQTNGNANNGHGNGHGHSNGNGRVPEGAIVRSRSIAPPPGAMTRSSTATVTPLRPQPVGDSRAMQRTAIAPGAAIGTRRSRKAQRKPPKPASPLVYAIRLLILGVGVGAIAGTILSIWNPKSRPVDAAPERSTPAADVQPANAANLATLIPGDGILRTPIQAVTLKLGQPLSALTNSIQNLIAQNEGLTAGVYLVDQDNGNYIDIGGAAALQAASTIKVPVLVAFLQDVDAGKIRLDEELPMLESDVAEGSGEFQYQAVGTKWTALETARQMIVISDNSATNMLIRRMGGAQALNQRFRSWGLTATVINNPLADLAGTNTTSAKDLTTLLTAVTQGKLLSLRSRDRLMEIMQGTVTNTLIPAGIGEAEDVLVAHKTGNIDTMVGDTGIVDMASGKRYVLTVLVQRPVDDSRAQELIRQISNAVYQYYKQAQTAATVAPQGSLAPATTPADPNAASTAGPTDTPTVPAAPAVAPVTPSAISGTEPPQLSTPNSEVQATPPAASPM